MSAVCPSGHTSATEDYCDQCGAPIAPPPPGLTRVLPEAEEADTAPAAVRAPCPACGTARSGDDRYCESCGHDHLAPPGATGWEAVASADRAQYERIGARGLEFPAGRRERRFALNGGSLRIGRSRPGEPAPELDLAGTLEDPGVSHRHAVLERQPDGAYTIRDLGSTNGTTVNDDPAPVSADTGVKLADGDRVRLGAWTTITIRARPGS